MPVNVVAGSRALLLLIMAVLPEDAHRYWLVGGGRSVWEQYHYTNLTKTSEANNPETASQSEALCSLIMIYHLFIFLMQSLYSWQFSQLYGICIVCLKAFRIVFDLDIVHWQ